MFNSHFPCFYYWASSLSAAKASQWRWRIKNTENPLKEFSIWDWRERLKVKVTFWYTEERVQGLVWRNELYVWVFQDVARDRLVQQQRDYQMMTPCKDVLCCRTVMFLLSGFILWLVYNSKSKPRGVKWMLKNNLLTSYFVFTQSNSLFHKHTHLQSGQYSC